MLDLPDEVYNWLVSFFQDRSHCTYYQREVSPVLDITASIVQGSAVGPAAYVVVTADLNVVTSGNELIKFADDTFMVIPATNVPGRNRVTTIKILGVTFTNSLSVAEYVHNVISSCAEALHTLRVLRAHGMDDASVQTI